MTNPTPAMSPILHHVLTASSGTIGSLTGYRTYAEIDAFLGWFATEYVEQQRPLAAVSFLGAIREALAVYKQEQAR